MPTPSRFPQGISNAAPWQMFAGMGVENPFFYHQFYDDFDVLPAATDGWTVTNATGTAALSITLDGGNYVMTTAASASSFVSIQRVASSFQPTAGKKLYFVARLSLSDVTNSVVIAGLFPNAATTPFTGTPANGIWISKASGGTQLVLNVANNSVVTSTNFPAASYTLAANVSFDVGFEVTSGSGAGTGPTIRGSLAPSLVSYIPQSGTGAANSTNRAPTIVSTAPLLTTLQATVLAPILAVETGNSSALSLTSDFVGCFKER
jgi:hypothetical protein